LTSNQREKIAEAVTLHEAGNLRATADIYREVLKQNPDNVEALHFLGVVLCDGGIYDQALPLFEKAIALAGPDSSILFNYGVALRSLGRLTQASRAFRHAAEASPGRVDCWHNLGESYRQLGRLTDAVDSFNKATKADPYNEPAWFNLGNVLVDQGFNDEAIQAYERVVTLNSTNIQARNNLGIALRQADKLEAAVAMFREVLDIDPTDAAAYNNLGIALQALGRLDEAVLAFTGALSMAPDYMEAICNLGKLYEELEKFDQALICYQSALAVDALHLDSLIGFTHCRQRQGQYEEVLAKLDQWEESDPNNLRVTLARANVLRDQGKYDLALAEFDRILNVVPDHPAALTNKALTLQHQGECEQAIEVYRRALTYDPENELIHSNLAQAFLLSGHDDEGRIEFEWRLRTNEVVTKRKELPGVPWVGEDISGKQLLVWCEQGLGDIIQFIRFLPKLCELGAIVTLQCPQPMVRLLKSMEYSIDIIPDDGEIPKVDHNVPLMSLPLFLGNQTIPISASYLNPEIKLVEYWRQRIAGSKLKIGIAWQGNPNYQADRSRSIPLAELQPLLTFRNADFYGLQKGQGVDQIKLLRDGSRLIDLSDDLDKEAAFVDTAAAMTVLDLIITSDTAIPHLAGALGRPVWLLTSYAPDWRWGLGSSKCPWYPTMRLFRQLAPGDWKVVVRDVAKALKTFKMQG